MKPQGVSIIICCHNGANRLPETLRHLARQRVPSYVPWEVIVVDNGSTDGSAAVARLEWRKRRVDACLKIVVEPVLGLSRARACGFNEAQYEYMLLCDDDNWLEESYVSTAFAILSGNDNIGALGGFGKLAFEIPPPTLSLSYIFAAGQQAPQSGKVPSNRLYGAGCVIRHSAYAKLLDLGFVSLLTDRRGGQLTSGGDYELCLALAILGFDIWYDDRLRFTHYITRERLSWNYFVRYASESSKCFNVLTSYKMVAAQVVAANVPWLLVSRNFLACACMFVDINVRRIVRLKRDDPGLLYFRHLVFSYKLIAYFSKFRQMVNAHKQILEFERRCTASHRTLKPVVRRDYIPTFRLSFFSRPSRQLR